MLVTIFLQGHIFMCPNHFDFLHGKAVPQGECLHQRCFEGSRMSLTAMSMLGFIFIHGAHLSRVFK